MMPVDSDCQRAVPPDYFLQHVPGIYALENDWTLYQLEVGRISLAIYGIT